MAVLTTFGLAAQAARAHGVYWARVQAQFLAPQSSANPNGLITASSPLVNVAGLVGQMVDPSAGAAQVGSESVTLADEGVKHGSTVRLPNTGGQWVKIFKTPALDVQAVGTTASEVADRMRRLTASIALDLRQLQDESHVRAIDRITLQVTSSPAPVYYQKGSPVRAAAAVLVLGLGLTLVGTTAMSRRVRRRTVVNVPSRGSRHQCDPVPA